MSRYFSFRSTPSGAERGGRYTAATASKIGSAVVVTGADGENLAVASTTGTTVAPAAGQGGVLVYEALFVDGPADSPDDVVDSPAAAQVQVVRGKDVKIVLTNDADYDMFTPLGLDTVGANVGVEAAGLWIEDDVNPWATVVEVLSTVTDAESIVIQLNF